jgi:hypothetical protein
MCGIEDKASAGYGGIMSEKIKPIFIEIGEIKFGENHANMSYDNLINGKHLCNNCIESLIGKLNNI